MNKVNLFWNATAVVFATITAVGVKVILQANHWLAVGFALFTWLAVYIGVIIIGGMCVVSGGSER